MEDKHLPKPFQFPYTYYKYLILVFLIFLINCGSKSRMENLKSDHQIQASVLFDAFINNKMQANSDYLDKVLEVVGPLKKVDYDEAKTLVLTLDSNHEEGNVLCKMEKPGTQLISQIHLGETVKLKGRCLGYRLDVVLCNCVFM